MTNIRKTTILQDILAAMFGHNHTPNMQLNIAHDMAIDFFESYAPHLLDSDDQIANWDIVNGEFSASTSDEIRLTVEAVWSIHTLTNSKHRNNILMETSVALVHDICMSIPYTE